MKSLSNASIEPSLPLIEKYETNVFCIWDKCSALQIVEKRICGESALVIPRQPMTGKRGRRTPSISSKGKKFDINIPFYLNNYETQICIDKGYATCVCSSNINNCENDTELQFEQFCIANNEKRNDALKQQLSNLIVDLQKNIHVPDLQPPPKKRQRIMAKETKEEQEANKLQQKEKEKEKTKEKVKEEKMTDEMGIKINTSLEMVNQLITSKEFELDDIKIKNSVLKRVSIDVCHDYVSLNSFLVKDKTKSKNKEEKEKENSNDVIQLISDKERDFYIIYKDLYNNGYWIKFDRNFGGDLVLYSQNPNVCHSKYVVVCLTQLTMTNKQISNYLKLIKHYCHLCKDKNRKLLELDVSLMSIVRVCASVKKTLLVAYTRVSNDNDNDKHDEHDKNVQYWCIKWNYIDNKDKNDAKSEMWYDVVDDFDPKIQ